MNNQADRRTAGKRVSFGSLVEICGNEPGGPAFEAETLDVSAAGMHVRTAYLPEEGAPLVCRFHDRDREIIVEGVVAWRHGEARGGEFGVQFTALDSGSVDALRELTEDSLADEAEEAPAAPAAASAANVDTGAKVRLHIDGLGAPMKARVRAGVGHRLDVGSNLEFLRVGRELTLESLEGGAKRSARIEAVSVSVDPGTQVPQLVVALRYADVDGTPQPLSLDADPVGTHRSPAVAGADPRPADLAARGGADAPELRKAGSLSHAPPSIQADEPVDEFFEQPPAPGADDEEIPMLRSRFGAAAGQAGELASAAGKQAVDLGGRAARGLGRWVGEVTRQVRERQGGEKAAEPAPTRRTTALPGAAGSGMDSRRLRPQAGAGRPVQAAMAATSAPGPAEARSRRMRRMGISAAGIALLALIAVVALGKPSTPPGAEQAAAEPVAATPAAVTPAAAPATPAPEAPGSADPTDGVVANVPLFGPTPMATVEAAPLEAPTVAAGAPADGLDEEEGAAPPAAAGKGDVVASAPELEGPEDEAFPEAKASEPTDKKLDPRDVKPWGRGTVREPTIHRLRLDASGAAIQGAITPTGFTVVIPGRQVMEAGRTIAKRDSRIAKVRTANTASGAQISFSFRDGVPGYKVRLRKDFVEILISAPEKKDAARKKEAKKPAERIARATP